MAIQQIQLRGGVDLVTPKQNATPGTLQDCLNFEVANRGGYTHSLGIRSYSGGVANGVINPYVFHNVAGFDGINIGTVTDFNSFQEGRVVQWGAGGTYNAKKETLTTVDGSASISFARRTSNTALLFTICDVQGRLPAPGDIITVAQIPGTTAQVTGSPVLASEIAKTSLGAFGTIYSSNLAGPTDAATDLINDLDMDAVSDGHAYTLPVSPLGSAKGGFFFDDRLHLILDIETWAFTSGSEQPSEGDIFYLYYTGTAPSGSFRPYLVDKVITESGEWDAGTAVGKIQLVLSVSSTNKGSVVAPTDCRNVTTGTSNPLTIGALVRSTNAGMWREVGSSIDTGLSGGIYERMDLGHEVRFIGGENYPTVLNRANRNAALETAQKQTPWMYSGTVTSAGWVNPTNAQDPPTGTVTTQLNDLNIRAPLLCTNFNVNIPASAVVLGVEMRYIRRSTAANVRDRQIILIGVPNTSQDKRSGDIWPVSPTALTLSGPYGGDSDLWNTNLSAEVVNSTGFGVSIAAERATTTGGRREIDSVQIRITYQDRSSVVYFHDPVTANDVAEGRVIWYHKKTGDWSTLDAEGTMTIYELTAPSAVLAGYEIRSGDNGTGNLIAVVASTAERVYLPASNRLETNVAQWEFEAGNFFANVGTEQIFGVSGADFGFSWDGTYCIRIRTGVEENQDTPRHVCKHLDQLLLGYAAGSVIASDAGYPESFAAIVGGTSGVSSPISDDTITYPTFAGGAQEIPMGDAIYGLTSRNDQNVFVGCQKSRRQIVGSAGALIQTVIDPSIGMIEYTLQNLGRPIFCDFQGVKFDDGTLLSSGLTPWLSDRIQRAGAALGNDRGPLRAELVRNKMQYRLYFRNGDLATITLRDGPEPTLQRLPFAPVMTCSGVTSGGKDVLFLAPYGMAENGAFFNDLKAAYAAISAIVPNTNLQVPAFVYQGEVGITWDDLLPMDSFVIVNGFSGGREWDDKKYDRMIVSGLCYGFAPFGAQYGVNFMDIDETRTVNVNAGRVTYTADKPFTEQYFSTTVITGRDGYALTVRLGATGDNLYGGTSDQIVPYKFRPVTFQSIILFQEPLKDRRA